ncbi:MAG TPA: hypothetical protein VLS25_13670, partial [Dehalococcoidia bacterium]|nr:hypothetical protein [Dehalococcoidia bacterium]
PAQEDTDGDGIADACEPRPPIAVGGRLGLLTEPSSTEGAGPQSSSHSSPLPPIALAAFGAAATGAAALYLRWRRRA